LVGNLIINNNSTVSAGSPRHGYDDTIPRQVYDTTAAAASGNLP
jgi:hypothetical protein